MTQPAEHRSVTVDEARADYQGMCLQVRVLEDAIRQSDETIAACLLKAQPLVVTPTYIEVQPTDEFWALLDGHRWLEGQLRDALAGRQYAYDVYRSILAHTSPKNGVDTNVSTQPDMHTPQQTQDTSEVPRVQQDPYTYPT